MPHLIIEYSANLVEQNIFDDVFKELHVLLVNRLPAQLTHCKSRAYEAKHYYVGDGNKVNAFLHLTIKLMPGRSIELLKEAAADVMFILKQYFKTSLQTLDLQITIEVCELSPVYLKKV